LKAYGITFFTPSFTTRGNANVSLQNLLLFIEFQLLYHENVGRPL